MFEGLTRYHKDYSDMWADDDGEWVRYADVAEAWAAKIVAIRKAVEAERSARREASGTSLAAATERQTQRDAARAALDKLLEVAP